MPANIWCLLCVFLITTGCASLPGTEVAQGIGPYRFIHARLLVIEPKRRWQVMLDWQAETPVNGHARLTHAASNTIIEMRWANNDIQLRDSNTPEWRKASMEQLAEQGIVISPYILSKFLAGQIPPGFRETGPNTWERKHGGELLRVVWQAEAQRLEFSDIRHGRRATLMIINGENKQPDSRTSQDKPAHV